MPLAVHALDVDDVIILLGFVFGIDVILRCRNLLMGKVSA